MGAAPEEERGREGGAEEGVEEGGGPGVGEGGGVETGAGGGCCGATANTQHTIIISPRHEIPWFSLSGFLVFLNQVEAISARARLAILGHWCWVTHHLLPTTHHYHRDLQTNKRVRSPPLEKLNKKRADRANAKERARLHP